jgi:hypothetical protein
MPDFDRPSVFRAPLVQMSSRSRFARHEIAIREACVGEATTRWEGALRWSDD